VTEEPRDRMFEPVARQKEMAWLAEVGVSGIKVDFFHSDKQAGIQLYLDILADAAEAGIMVNFHGSTIPRGWERTWPNLMSMEGVRGAEQYAFRPTYPEEAPWHNTVLAFSRNVVGPMDYTPVTFSDAMYPHITTNAHELALAVVFESSLQHFADSVDSYRAQPPEVVEYLRTVPTVWDESRLLAGEPGRYAVVARRSGAQWFVAGINGVGEPLPVSLSLGGLGVDGAIHVIADGDDARTFAIADRELGAHATLDVTMAPFGGFSAMVPPQ
jgi:hypothetical protein